MQGARERRQSPSVHMQTTKFADSSAGAAEARRVAYPLVRRSRPLLVPAASGSQIESAPMATKGKRRRLSSRRSLRAIASVGCEGVAVVVRPGAVPLGTGRASASCSALLRFVRCESTASRLQVARNARGCGSLTVQLKLADDAGRRVNLAERSARRERPFSARSSRPAHRGRSLGRVRPGRRSPVAVGCGPSATRRHAPRSRTEQTAAECSTPGRVRDGPSLA
jgi:hypothetical protein